jgi:hypothetical protein
MGGRFFSGSYRGAVPNSAGKGDFSISLSINLSMA